MLYDLPAPAKLNLFLHVVGRRPDGYHLLQTVFRFVDLADSVDIDTRRDGLVHRETDMPGVPPEQDLAVRAALALQRHTGTALGAQLSLRKRVPSGGGLGGGSSDAATVLIALNRLWRTGLSRGQLMRIGLELGADVPVFVFGQNAFAQGIGDLLTAVELPSRAYVVVQPAQSVPTEGVFKDPDLTRDTDPVKITDFSGRSSDFGHNDLQAVVVRHYPVVQQALAWLDGAGYPARMTGSGACLFIEFPDLQQASVAHQNLLAKMRTDHSGAAGGGASCPVQAIMVANGLAEHPLRNWIES